MKHKGKALFSGNGQPQGCRRLGRRVLSGVSLAVLGVGLLIGGCSRDVKGDDALLEAGVEVKTRLGGVYLEDAVAVHPEPSRLRRPCGPKVRWSARPTGTTLFRRICFR